MLLRVLFVFLLFIINPSASLTILAVGKTGRGKSFTATLFGCNAEVGHDSDSMTKNVEIHHSEDHHYHYIDTPGFDDSDKKVMDKDTTISIISAMQDNNIAKVDTVLWFVGEHDKAFQSLQREAKFIEELAMNSNTNVWNNVIVIFKGVSRYLVKDSIKKAIKTNNRSSDIANDQILAVQLYNHTIDSDLSKEAMLKSGIYKKEELKGVYEKIIQEQKHQSNPIQIVFKDATCIKCGITTDPRLAKKFKCHTHAEHKHDGETEKYVKKVEYKHYGHITTEQKPDDPALKVLNFIPLFGPMVSVAVEAVNSKGREGRVWSCCGGGEGSHGCKSESEYGWRYTCCHKDLDGKPPACKKVCGFCGKTWGNSEGCLDTEHEFKKKDLVMAMMNFKTV